MGGYSRTSVPLRRPRAELQGGGVGFMGGRRGQSGDDDVPFDIALGEEILRGVNEAS